jgi:iron complex transport system ATP-binding protein
MSVRIKVHNLSFRYGAMEVLHGIDFAVQPGDFVGIIGPNGSGKSTLLKNMAALLTPSAGEITLNGKDLRRWPRRSLARQLALVGQERSAGFNFLVEDVVAMGRYPYQERFSSPKEADRRAVERAMHLTGCYHLRERELFSLSGGERQRVILARALAQETPCLLLDEPTSFLDLGYQVELLELLQSLNREEGLTIIVVMHDLNLASRYCGRLLMLSQGKIYACGMPEEVLTRDHIRSVYRTEVMIDPHPLDGSPQVIPFAAGAALRQNHGCPKVHIIGGGGSATPLINELVLAGVPLSAGVLTVGDSDWATARRFGLEMVEETPFAPISSARHQDNLALIKGAAAVVLAPLFIGPGNLLNLEAAATALEEKKPVYLINEPPVEERDFTGGRGIELYSALIEKGAQLITRAELGQIARPEEREGN